MFTKRMIWRFSSAMTSDSASLEPAEAHSIERLVVTDDGDDPLGTRHLQLEVGIVRHRHELGERRAAEEGVVGAAEVDHLEPDGLAAEVLLGAEDDVQLDLAERGCKTARDDAVEDRRGRVQLLLLDLQLLHRVPVEDVDAAAAVDEDARESNAKFFSEMKVGSSTSA